MNLIKNEKILDLIMDLLKHSKITSFINMEICDLEFNDLLTPAVLSQALYLIGNLAFDAKNIQELLMEHDIIPQIIEVMNFLSPYFFYFPVSLTLPDNSFYNSIDSSLPDHTKSSFTTPSSSSSSLTSKVSPPNSSSLPDYTCSPHTTPSSSSSSSLTSKVSTPNSSLPVYTLSPFAIPPSSIFTTEVTLPNSSYPICLYSPFSTPSKMFTINPSIPDYMCHSFTTPSSNLISKVPSPNFSLPDHMYSSFSTPSPISTSKISPTTTVCSLFWICKAGNGASSVLLKV
jgi:hypothetical protein